MPAFQLNMEDTRPKFCRPEILQHPHIPRSLAGINPRSIMGQEWWDPIRRQAYRANNGNCWACGRPCTEDLYKPWLEAHEFFEFDYFEGTMTFKEVVALDHSCHSFIHSGRLWVQYRGYCIPKSQVEHIIRTRMEILDVHHLRPFIFTKAIAYMLKGDREMQATAKAWADDGLAWERGPKYPKYWKMIFEGHAYCQAHLEGVPIAPPTSPTPTKG